ncbi:hypothetical protein OEZ86_002824 [Tetradesmus obliquus]|nr:hypothetical protein OEZ86_002824 [Tetradesmus obliquus]
MEKAWSFLRRTSMANADWTHCHPCTQQQVAALEVRLAARDQHAEAVQQHLAAAEVHTTELEQRLAAAEAELAAYRAQR